MAIEREAWLTLTTEDPIDPDLPEEDTALSRPCL